MSVEEDKTESRKAVGAKVMWEVFMAAKAAFKRWDPDKDSYEQFFQFFAGELNSSIGRSAGLHMPSEQMVRDEAAEELRVAAAKHPKSSAKHAAFLEAADMVEKGPR
ncbi:hypothetical protein [Streptomyces zaomyceticus]|uniref:hypothetical protein n=1 Tax=Streptomyces zaomyceticus TaxID=68286 RepID=UPI0037A28CD5